MNSHKIVQQFTQLYKNSRNSTTIHTTVYNSPNGTPIHTTVE